MTPELGGTPEVSSAISVRIRRVMSGTNGACGATRTIRTALRACWLLAKARPHLWRQCPLVDAMLTFLLDSEPLATDISARFG
eukprot:841604-Rhodomonas_salina.1